MRHQVGTALAGWCTECTAWRRGALAVLVAVLVATGAACRDDRSGEQAALQAAGSDGRASRTIASTSATAKPVCPPTGAWQMCSVIDRLERAGLAPRQQPGRVVEAPLGSPGVAILLGRSELRIFLYADRATREREQAKLDNAKYVAADEPLSMQVEPTLIASENLLAILRSRSDHQRERVSDALTAGPPQKPRTKG
jgi:hypothetical protein